ncbi:NAD-dependent succinate-semialdehyde dehydrogenase [Actinoallomurus iriomotensis]|uniref:NAD-dependent succinate-semialdehyde dehydrogenase n=1 Tax=Actinoallomurus iriomotensis TaxID=478107 RepID=A0A9W6VZT1_9ACTN|nr:NAD-dependent succinate-semialdehyde dehydrogenase [Actinoallomurus iriomotensis]GLY85042.1 NAD-dependent succinate-semialdehyde dehydrogenase [Actinoallomurus iriomotensis]
MNSTFDRTRLRDPGLLREDLFIDGEWTPGSAGERADVLDPATGAVVARMAAANEADVVRAVEAAKAAAPGWARVTAPERARILRRWYELIVANADDLATILTAEQGKPLAEARGEILYGAGFVEWYAEEAKRTYGDVIPTNAAGRRLLAVRQPVGVSASITPWNFPSAMILRKAGPALAAGCPMIIKPAEETPLSATALAELGVRAGIPAGVLGVVSGEPAMIGEILTSHPAVRALSFTGSTEVGKLLMAQSARTVKKVALELGGNAPLIVFDDADLDAAVAGAMASKFRNAGQTCVCANRILVQSGVHDAFVDRLRVAVEALKVGNGFEEGSEQGPLISPAAVAKVERHIGDAVGAGATVLAGGGRHELGRTFFQPTLLTGVRPDMLISREETFGPVAPVIAFDTEDEAIAIANDTPFGLAAYFFTTDLGRTWRVGEALEFGVVGVNTGLISYEGAPFGGVKESGLGREGSRHGIDEFTELKYLCVDGVG